MNTFLPFVVLVVVYAAGPGIPLAAAAASSSSSTATSPGTAPASSLSGPAPAPASGTGTGTGTVTSGVATPLSTVPVTLLSTNPTAVPLGSITSGEPSMATTGLFTTFPAGATPSGLPGAPPLPDISTLLPSNYPPLDKPPPITDPLVQGWINDVKNSNIPIPNIPPTLPGGCGPNTPGAATNATASGTCWWPCGHCSRSTDVITCADKLTWGSSFDDGPAFYTPNLLDYLNQNQLHTTFFVVGSRAISFPQTLQTEYMSGHQIAVHTWSHPFLTTQSTEQIIAEFGWTKKIIKDVTGVTPIFFRPPFGDIDDRVRAIARAMNLIPIIWTSNPQWDYTFDTNDFNIPGGLVSSSEVIHNFQSILNNATSIDSGFIVLEHDLFEQTVQLATGYIIPDALAFQPKLSLMPIVQCLQQPLSDAYIETNNNQTNPLPSSPQGASGVATGTTHPTAGAAQGGAAIQHGTSSVVALFASLAGLLAGFAVVF